MCNEAYRLLAFYNSNESSASTNICKLPSRYNLAYSSGSSTASEVNAQSDPGVVLNPFRLPSSQCEAYSQHLYKCQCCFVVDCILQILFSSYPISLSFNQSLVAKIKKYFNQSTMSLSFCVILFYIIFLVSAAASVGTEQMSTGHLVPLYLPLSEFVNTGGTI